MGFSLGDIGDAEWGDIAKYGLTSAIDKKLGGGGGRVSPATSTPVTKSTSVGSTNEAPRVAGQTSFKLPETTAGKAAIGAGVVGGIILLVVMLK